MLIPLFIKQDTCKLIDRSRYDGVGHSGGAEGVARR
jgi:hypothetical protein